MASNTRAPEGKQGTEIATAAARDRDLERWRTVRSSLDMPPKEERQALLDGVDETIRMLVRQREVVVEPIPLRRVWNPPKLMHLPAAQATPDRPTLVLHPWIVYYMCRGLYVWDQRCSKHRAFAAGRLPLRINIMAATKCVPKPRHYVNNFVRQLRDAMPTQMDEMPHDLGGRILCTCTVDRELTAEEAQLAIPAHMQLEGAKHIVQLKNFIILPGNGIRATIAAGDKGMRFAKHKKQCKTSKLLPLNYSDMISEVGTPHQKTILSTGSDVYLGEYHALV